MEPRLNFQPTSGCAYPGTLSEVSWNWHVNAAYNYSEELYGRIFFSQGSIAMLTHAHPSWDHPGSTYGVNLDTPMHAGSLSNKNWSMYYDTMVLIAYRMRYQGMMDMWRGHTLSWRVTVWNSKRWPMHNISFLWRNNLYTHDHRWWSVLEVAKSWYSVAYPRSMGLEVGVDW